jgi:hypothetical protein
LIDEKLISEIESNDVQAVEQGLQILGSMKEWGRGRLVEALSKSGLVSDEQLIQAMRANWQHEDTENTLFLLWARRQTLPISLLAVDWLKENVNSSWGINFVIGLVGVYGDCPEIVNPCWKWFQAYQPPPDFPQLTFAAYLSILVVYSSIPFIVSGAIDWIQANGDNDTAATVLCRLLKKSSTEPLVVDTAVNWISMHGEHHEAGSVRAALHDLGLTF